MRFIHIVPERPGAAGTGAQIRGQALSRALSRRGPVETVVVQDVLAEAGLAPVRARSHIEIDLPDAILAAIVDRAAPGAGDVVIVEGVSLSALARRFAALGARVILDAHNVESDLLRQTDRARHPVLAPLLRRGRWGRAERAERDLLQRVSAVWACSTLDAERMRRLAPGLAAVHVVPNPVPDWCLAAAVTSRRDGIAALFVGHLGYRPNLVAARRLVRGIFPVLRRRDPAAELTLAGRAPHRSMRQLLTPAVPGVRLVPDPPDLMSLYDRASMALLPLTEGGGTRIKALEALALGLPVVASAKAVEGLHLTAGRDFLLAETDAEFVAAAVRLSEDAALREALAEAGRSLAQTCHGPQAIDAAVGAALAAGGAAR